jgi:hypothetical protein
MQEQDGRQELLRQMTDLGDRLTALAGRMAKPGGVNAERLADLQALAAQLTDVADELAQYVDTAGGQTAR